MAKKDKTITQVPEDENAVIKVNKKMTGELMTIIKRYKQEYSQFVPEAGRVCSKCRKNKSVESFSMARNPLMHNSRISICTECVDQFVAFEDYGEAQYFLVLLGLPFVEDIWEKSFAHKSPVRYYIKIMNLGQYLEMEAATINRVKAFSEAIDLNPYEVEASKLTSDERGYLQGKWGEHYSLIDCVKLQEYEEQMKEDYIIETRSHEDYLQKVAKVSLIIDNMIRDADYKGVKDMSKTLDDLMKSAGFSQSSKKGNKDDNDFNAFGTIFEMAEKKGFIPKFHTDESKDIVDETIKNVQNWTYQLIAKEPDLQVLLENAAKRVIEQEQKDKDESDSGYAEIEEIQNEHNEKT